MDTTTTVCTPRTLPIDPHATAAPPLPAEFTKGPHTLYVAPDSTATTIQVGDVTIVAPK